MLLPPCATNDDQKQPRGTDKMRRDGSISLGDAKIWRALRERDAWMSNGEIAKAAGVSERTVQNFTKKHVTLGVLDQTAVCPAYFRISQRVASQKVNRLTEALHVYGLDSVTQRNAAD
jgi:hypothetical protein